MPPRCRPATIYCSSNEISTATSLTMANTIMNIFCCANCQLTIHFLCLSIKIHVNFSYQQPFFSPINLIQFNFSHPRVHIPNTITQSVPVLNKKKFPLTFACFFIRRVFSFYYWHLFTSCACGQCIQLNELHFIVRTSVTTTL